MKQRLDQLKILTRPLEPDLNVRQRWTQKVNAHAEDFMESLVNGPAFRSTVQEGKGILTSPLTEEPQDPDLILKLLVKHVEQPGVQPQCLSL